MDPIKDIEARMWAMNITQYRLSKMTGITASTLNDVFRHRNPTLCVLVAICTALDLEINIKLVKPRKK